MRHICSYMQEAGCPLLSLETTRKDMATVTLKQQTCTQYYITQVVLDDEMRV